MHEIKIFIYGYELANSEKKYFVFAFADKYCELRFANSELRLVNSEIKTRACTKLQILFMIEGCSTLQNAILFLF